MMVLDQSKPSPKDEFAKDEATDTAADHPLQEDRMIPEWAQRKLNLQRDLALSLCRDVGMLHYGDQDQSYINGNEQCFYDIHCLVTTAFCIFRRLIPYSIPVSDFDDATLPFRVRVSMLACFAIAMKFDDDSAVIPCVCLLRQLATPEEGVAFTNDASAIHTIASVETHIVGSVNVFDVSQHNHHRRAVESLVKMAEDEHIDDQSAVRATALSFFFVFNTYGEVELLTRSYDTHTIGKAIAIATLFCLERSGVAPTPRKSWGTRRQFTLARVLLREVALKGDAATKKELGGALVDPKTWECRATRQNTIQNAVNGLTAHLS